MHQGSSGAHDLAERFVVAAEYLNRRMNSDRLDTWNGLDMTSARIKVLMLLQNIGPMRMGTIARHLGTTLSATTGIVDRLVERDLVTRVADPSDRRVVICELTPGGTAAVEQLWRIERERILPVAELLGQERLATAVQALEAIRGADEELQRRSDAAGSSG